MDKNQKRDLVTNLKQPQRTLTAPQFQGLAEMPAEVEWLLNLSSNPNTRSGYESDIKDFLRFAGIERPEELRLITRAHVIAWRTEIEQREIPDGHDPDGMPVFRYPADATIRRKLSALSSLFQSLCEKNTVLLNPVLGVKRPKANNNEGKTAALGDAQVRDLLNAPDPDTLKGKRDRAILATLFFHALRRQELCDLKVKHIHSRQGVMYLEVHGKGGKTRYVEMALPALRLIQDYLDVAGHERDHNGALFRPIKNNTTGTLNKPLHPSSVYRDIIRRYAEQAGLTQKVQRMCTHVARTTAITNTLANGADLAEAQQWAGHANISTTRLYDRRKRRPEDSPSYKVSYGMLER